MATVYLALGSNIGDSREYIKSAVKALGKQVRDIEQAPVYRTRAVGYTEQPEFLNTVIRGKTDLEPRELLKFVKDVEKEVGRVWTFRFGPRQIDVDIIFYDDLVMKTRDLTIPHAALIGRDFVLKPLVDLDPKLKDPASGQTVTQLLAKFKPQNKAVVERID
ncbi:MAG: 2-amino-4-hydroxy-6-hydroxymethyldihydropteridine diphosphokinase [Candidatus Saccharimonadales bacterium]